MIIDKALPPIEIQYNNLQTELFWLWTKIGNYCYNLAVNKLDEVIAHNRSNQTILFNDISHVNNNIDKKSLSKILKKKTANKKIKKKTINNIQESNNFNFIECQNNCLNAIINNSNEFFYVTNEVRNSCDNKKTKRKKKNTILAFDKNKCKLVHNKDYIPKFIGEKNNYKRYPTNFDLDSDIRSLKRIYETEQRKIKNPSDENEENFMNFINRARCKAIENILSIDENLSYDEVLKIIEESSKLLGRTLIGYNQALTRWGKQKQSLFSGENNSTLCDLLQRGKNPSDYGRPKRKSMMHDKNHSFGWNVQAKDKEISDNIKRTMKKRSVEIPNFGKIKVREDLTKEIFKNFIRIKNITFRHTAGRYFLILQVECEIDDQIPKGEKIMTGIDLNVNATTAICPSDRELKIPDAPQPLKKMLKKKVAIQRILSTKKKGSKRHKIYKNKLRQLEYKIKCIRKDWQHKGTTEVIKSQPQNISCENLKVKNMTKSARGTIENPGKNVKAKSGLNRAINDNGLYEIRRMLEYKCHWNGIGFYLVNPVNSSRTCQKCGYISEKNRKTQKLFHCISCGYKENADLNAADEIEKRGKNLLERSENV